MAFHDTINTGTSPNDGQGDGLRTNMRKLIENDNFLKQEHEGLQDEFDNVFKDNLIYDVAGLGENNFKAVKIDILTGSSSDYQEKVILLIPISESNNYLSNKISGTILAAKTGSNLWDSITIDAQSTYNSTVAAFNSNGQRYNHKLVTCNFNGVKWLALKLASSDNPHREYWFRGFHITSPSLDSNNDSLKVIAYYQTATSTALNTEINNSIQDYTTNTYKQISSHIHVNGNVNCVSLVQTSDKKFKSNIELIDGIWALDVFKKLNFSFYDFSKTNSKQAGLIAQEVEKILPQAVHTSENGEKGLNYNYIDIVCKSAIQHFIKTQIQ